MYGDGSQIERDSQLSILLGFVFRKGSWTFSVAAPASHESMMVTPQNNRSTLEPNISCSPEYTCVMIDCIELCK